MIASFYSFKGGVGRTLAVAHAAWMTAARHRDRELGVLVIDMDLEAPGLDRYFRFPGARECEGLAGLVAGYAEQPPERRRAWLDKALRKTRYVLRSPKLSNLRFLPSGLDARPERYGDLVAFVREEVAAQDRSGGWPTLANRGFFADLRAALADVPYVFVDSRTGLADAAFASTILLADVLVACVRLNLAHLDGIEPVLGSFLLRQRTTSDDPAAPYLVVVTPVPSRGGEDVSTWFSGEIRRRYRRRSLGEEDAATQLGAPLALVPTLHRLYEEPWLEIGGLAEREKLLVDERGRPVPGFDAAVPLMRGYRGLVGALAALNAEVDPVAARALTLRAMRKKWWETALHWWERWAREDVDAVDVLDELLGKGHDAEVADAAERALLEGREGELAGMHAYILYAKFSGRAFRERRRAWIERAVESPGTATLRAAALRARAELDGEDAPTFLPLRYDRLGTDLEEAVRLLESAGEQAERDEALVELAEVHWRFQEYGALVEAMLRIRTPATAPGLPVLLSRLGATELAAACLNAPPELGIVLRWRSLVAARPDLAFQVHWYDSDADVLEQVDADSPLGRLSRVHVSLLRGDPERAFAATEGLTEPLFLLLVHILHLGRPPPRMPPLALTANYVVDLPLLALIQLFAPERADFTRLLPLFVHRLDGVYALGPALHALALFRAVRAERFEETFAALEDFCAAFPLPAAILGRPRPLVDALVARLPLDGAARERVERIRALRSRYPLPPEPAILEPLPSLPADRLRRAAEDLTRLSSRAIALL